MRRYCDVGPRGESPEILANGNPSRWTTRESRLMRFHRPAARAEIFNGTWALLQKKGRKREKEKSIECQRRRGFERRFFPRHICGNQRERKLCRTIERLPTGDLSHGD